MRLKSLKLIPLSETLYIAYSGHCWFGNFYIGDQILIAHVLCEKWWTGEGEGGGGTEAALIHHINSIQDNWRFLFIQIMVE